MTMIGKRRRGAAAFIASIALVAGGLLAAAPANAAASHCASGDACLWKDHTYVTNGVGTSFVRFEFGIPNVGTWQYSGTSIWAKDASSPISVHNNGRSNSIRIYTGLDYSGTYVQITKGNGDGNINNSVGIVTSSNFGGKIRSAKFV